jgi:predicted amino acid-binding ACT domain protein
MPRAADYTIQGFLYQFNKTALEILKAQDDDTITVEGIVEDIEVASAVSLTAIQCKYHEASTSFTPSAVYKPLLQMLKHFSDHPDANIRYILFAHFPGVGTSPPTVDKSTLRAALASKDKELQKHIKAVPSVIDLNGFEARFAMEFGPSYDDIVKEVSTELEANGIPMGDIETLAYPNAIHMIATLSVKHSSAERQATKKQFLSDLKAIRTTAISRWTLALKTRKKLLEARRKQLKVHLDKNARLRYFVVNPASIEDYESEIVLFISDYIDKYHFKPAHISTPVLCLCAKRLEIQDIQHRLYAKGIVATDGYVGAQFEETFFLREPLFCKVVGGKVKREFALRILSWDDHGELLNNRKCDDLFIIGEPDCNSLDTVDVNVERLAGATMKEIKYVMGVSNVYE